MAFSFRLETVLKVRKLKETQAQQELSFSIAERASVELKIKELDEKRQGAQEQWRILQQKPVTAEAFSHLLQYIEHVSGQISNYEEEVMRLNNVIEKKRQALQEAVQKVKILEKLREKQYTQWEKELSEAERRLLDSQATMRYNRPL